MVSISCKGTVSRRRPNRNRPHRAKVVLLARELDTVLAALRLWQKQDAHTADYDGAILEFAEEHGDALTNDEIDDLCERINCE
jgi:hypothetical protein